LHADGRPISRVGRARSGENWRRRSRRRARRGGRIPDGLSPPMKKEKFKQLDKDGLRLKVCDKIRVIGIHPKVVDTEEFKTRTILETCVGRTFQIKGFQKDWAEIHVGRFVGRRSWEETIWIEPEYMELVKQGKRKPTKARK